MMNQTSQARPKGFLPFLYSIGAKAGNIFLMQLFFVLYVLKGGIILGVFPAMSCVTKLFIKWFIEEDDDLKVASQFKENYTRFFKTSNQVGYALSAAFAFLFVDLRINENVIQSSILHTILLIIIFILGFLTIYTFPIMVGYTMGFKDTLKQAFFVALSTPVFTTASILGLMITVELIRSVPFIGVFFGAPLIVLPVAWFTFSGFKKMDELKEELEAEG